MTPLEETCAWLEHAVIGLQLCPFAKAVHARGQVRWVQSDATTPEALLEQLLHEMRELAACDAQAVETTLLVHPHVLHDFLDFNDFLDVADAALESLGLEGVLQVASFHPDYRFAGTAEDDITNATNRAPHPTLQLLREASVEQALAGHGRDTDAIVEANLRTLRRLGVQGWADLQVRIRGGR
jgi:uncharacterized protein